MTSLEPVNSVEPMGSLVELRGFTAVDPRSDRVLLDDIDFKVAPGEQVLLLGASGAGKSTLLDAIRGVVPHSVPLELTGECLVNGEPVLGSTVAQLTRTIGTVPQDPHASICLPLVEDEIALTLENHGVDPAEIPGRITELLGDVRAAHLRSHRTRILSGGWVQRIATVAALAARPRLVLADEPTSMLDGAGVSAVMELLTQLTGDDGALILVEHRLDELSVSAGGPGLPARTVVLEAGRILADGPTDAVLSEHAQRLENSGVWVPGVKAEAFAEFAELAEDPTPEASPALLRAAGLTVSPDPETPPVLDGLDLTVRAGERIVVRGDNGSGKTTLLTALAGLVRLRGRSGRSGNAGELTGTAPVMVFQNPEHQFLAHTVNDELGEDPLGTELADRFGLGHVGALNPFRLSGGEQRRLSVALGLLAARRREDPTVLLADEPTFGLDRASTTAVMSELARYAADGGAVVVVTHDDELTRAWATRVVRLPGRDLAVCGADADTVDAGERR
ncbi:ABC transporter ATP-binding protein [Citricoccus sp. NR2]|uniref:ABC transporter ATP-binding protein n=1 Tax=Citricoccus sp. NR2 TaxID=3004095 RepID=UPI0022DE8F26|nr:ABC transporter ATP-binding protein [Citricoccus sp. NR2]WBL19458.1 ATP-binding cassette domain-containing protein [Citricoccus sp. NR2]